MSNAHPQRFGPYVVLDRIGDGGMAEIFLAKMTGYSGFEKVVALKKIHPKYSQNDTFAQMLIHEAKLAAALTHFNVVQVHDLGEIDGQVYIAMEYIRGRDLAAVLSNTYRRRERLPIELTLFIATEFITGLEYAHRKRANDGGPLGIIHRDISPQNVLISYEGEVKVTDFGIARIISEKNTGFQLPGNLHGKFGYMSPEQALNKEIDQRSDVFSAGVVLWEMLVGARLFRGRDQRDTIEMVTSKDIPEPSSINEEVPPAVDRICAKALSRDRNTRYQTMGALLGELSRAAESLARRAGSRDLSVYMRRQFGTQTGGFKPGKTSRVERSSASQHSGFRKLAPLSEAPRAGTGIHRIPIGQILLRQGAINMGDLELALAEQRAQGGLIGEVLVSIAAIDDAELAQALATQANLPTISTEDLVALPPPESLLTQYPRTAAETACMVPIAVDKGDRRVHLAVCDPYDERGVLEAKVVLGVNDVTLLVAPRSAIREVLSTWYRPLDDEPAAPPLPLVDANTEGPTEEVVVVEGDEAATYRELPPIEAPLEPRVLIADADVVLARQLADRIEAEGYIVDVVHDGKAARAHYRETPPMVAFLDAALPGIDGYNLLLELRAHDQDAAVFVTSARHDEFRQAKALELGADDFLQKPLALEVTVSKIRREIQKRTRGQRMMAPPVAFSGVSGSLEDMTVIDISQSLELGQKTASVVVQYEDGRQGVLRIDKGEVKGATARGFDGPEAFYHLARPGKGRFRIEYRPSPISVNINEPNTFLMIEAMRHLDEGVAPDQLTDSLPSEVFEPLLTPVPEPLQEDPLEGDLAFGSPPKAKATSHRIPAKRFGPIPSPLPSAKTQGPASSGQAPVGGLGIEPIPLGSPQLTDDLTLVEPENVQAERSRRHSTERLEKWVAAQLDDDGDVDDDEEGPEDPITEVARITTTSKKPDKEP